MRKPVSVYVSIRVGKMRISHSGTVTPDDARMLSSFISVLKQMVGKKKSRRAKR